MAKGPVTPIKGATGAIGKPGGPTVISTGLFSVPLQWFKNFGKPRGKGK